MSKSDSLRLVEGVRHSRSAPHPGLALLVWLSGLLLVIVPAHAGVLPQTLFTTNWYSVLIMGNRSGYSCQTLRDSGRGVESVEQTQLQIRMDTQVLKVSRQERRCYDSALKLTSIDHEADQIGRKTRVSVTCQGDRLSYVKQSPDGESRQTLTVTQDFGHELHILRSLSRGEMKPGWTTTFSTFDCDLLKVDTITMTVLQATTEPRPGWIVKARSGLLGIETRTWIGLDGTLLRQEVPGMMGMTLTLVTEAEALAELSPLLLSSSIPVDSDPGPAKNLVSLTLRASSRSVPVRELLRSTSRQTVTDDGDNILVAVRAQSAPDLTSKIPITQPQLQEYLQPSDLAQSRDPLIVAKARAIIGNETDAWQAAQKLLSWVHRELAKVDSEPRPLSAREILTQMRGDCTEHSILLAALAQAVGIPAKLVAGLVYDDKAYHYHAWSELYVGQWVEMDATWSQPTVGPGHLLVASEALDSASMGRLSLASGRTMGALDLDIVTVQK